MSLPTLATSDDVEAVVEYLRSKPLGASLSEAKATLDSKLLDSKRLNTYESWGLITISNSKLTLTPEGRKLSQISDENKAEIFLNLLTKEKIYTVTLESIYHRNLSQITVEDVAAYWVEHFSELVATGSERSLKEQVTCFMSVASAAGLGDYFIGRRGSPTRLEVNRSNLEMFVRQPDEESEDSLYDKEDAIESSTLDNERISDHQESQLSYPAPQHQVEQLGAGSPSLHIDIQIHISSDATLEQIDKIFESMSKHLYSKDSN